MSTLSKTTTPDPAGKLPGIADVERDTGLSKDTLRVWERRYGFPAPQRDAQGERRYDEHQLTRLRHIRRLLDAGHRPGRVVALPLEQLLQLDTQADGAWIQRSGAMGGPSAAPKEPGRHRATQQPDLDAWFQLLRAHDAPGLRDAMTQTGRRHGLAHLIEAAIAPMNERVGQAWLDGQLAVHHEHVYTECVQNVLRQALGSLAAQAPMQPPRVLLTTMPGEPHGLGLLMAECFLALCGCQTLNLGVQTPLPDIVSAAHISRCDIVALGFTGAQNPRDARAALAQLHRSLPPGVALWTGGRGPFLTSRSFAVAPEAVADGGRPVYLHMAQLHNIAEAIARWRAERAAN